MFNLEFYSQSINLKEYHDKDIFRQGRKFTFNAFFFPLELAYICTLAKELPLNQEEGKHNNQETTVHTRIAMEEYSGKTVFRPREHVPRSRGSERMVSRLKSEFSHQL